MQGLAGPEPDVQCSGCTMLMPVVVSLSLKPARCWMPQYGDGRTSEAGEMSYNWIGAMAALLST